MNLQKQGKKMKDSGSYSQEEEFISGSDYSGEDYSEGDEEDYSEEDENTHTETENYESQQDDVTKQSDIPESEVIFLVYKKGEQEQSWGYQGIIQRWGYG